MKQTRLLMGMPITVEIVDHDEAAGTLIDEVFDYFTAVDERFSTYKDTSEISAINRGLPRERWSQEMQRVMELCEDTKRQTNGYFDIEHDGQLDPSGLVKGWAINNAATLLRERGVNDFYVDAGGDVQTAGHNPHGKPWRVGIRNPFDREQNIKVVTASGQGVATSGTYVRGEHIYDPHGNDKLKEVASLTVIGPDIYEADRFATAAYAMGPPGIEFIERRPGLEGYLVTADERATLTSGFEAYVAA